MKIPSKLHSEKGYVMVLVGISLTGLFALFILVADLGHVFVTKAELQNTADAAALAAVVDIQLGEDIAEVSATDFGQTHWVAGSSIIITPEDVQFGHYDGGTGVFQAGASPVNSVSVMARRTSNSPSGPLPLFFSAMFGKDVTDVSAKSIALLDSQVVGVKGKSRLIPYSVINSVVDANGDGLYDIGESINMHPKKDAPGNFGFLNFDGGSGDTPEVQYWIENGYDQEFIVPPGGSIPISGSTGVNGNSLTPSFLKIIDQVVFMPVHDGVGEQGANALFNVVGFLAVRIKAVKLIGKEEERYINAELISFNSSVLVTDPQATANNSLAKPRLVA